jgi:hypothetical protein
VAALLSLACLVHGSVNRTMRWLEAEVLAVREVMWGPGARDREERLRSYGQHLAMELAFGACRCGHGAGDAHGPCGRPDHQLTSWRPDVCQLPAFVATAVRGSPLTPPRTGAFAVSMLAEQLCQDRWSGWTSPSSTSATCAMPTRHAPPPRPGDSTWAACPAASTTWVAAPPAVRSHIPAAPTGR